MVFFTSKLYFKQIYLAQRTYTTDVFLGSYTGANFGNWQVPVISFKVKHWFYFIARGSSSTISKMNNIGITRDVFLGCMSAIYLFAFTSLYVQIPGEFWQSAREIISGASQHSLTCSLQQYLCARACVCEDCYQPQAYFILDSRP